MIDYPFPMPAWVEVLLDGLPAPSSPEVPANIFTFTNFEFQVRCGRQVLLSFPIKKLRASYKFRKHGIDCRRPTFALVVKIGHRSSRIWSFTRRLPFTRSKIEYLVEAERDQIRRWLSKCHRTVARFSSRTRRTRQRTVRPNPEVGTKIGTYYFQRGGDQSLIVLPMPYTEFLRTWSGTTTPGFSRLKRRNLPVNPHDVDIQWNRDSSWIQVVRDTLNPDNSSVWIMPMSYVFGSSATAPPFPTHLVGTEDVALQRLIDKMQSNLGANLAQDMAQIGQLNRLITNTTLRISRSLRALKARKFEEAANWLWNGTGRSIRYHSRGQPSFTSSLANNWLELQYGWKPLLMDIDGSMRSLANFYNLPEHVSRSVSASARKELITRGVETDDATHVAPVGTREDWVDTRVKYTLRYRIDSRLKSFLSQTGFTNPVNLIWEILPYSFVLDWFIPIGNYLSNLSAYDGLTFVDGCKTTFTRQRYISLLNFTGTYAGLPPGVNVSIYGSYRRDRYILKREKLTSFPSQNVPRFKNPLSVEHALNGIALLKAAFTR